MNRKIYPLSESFDYIFSRDGGAVATPLWLGIQLPANAVVKQLWLICTAQMTTTQYQVGSVASPGAIWDSGTSLVINSNTAAEQLQGTGKFFTGLVYLTFVGTPVTKGSIVFTLDYETIN